MADAIADQIQQHHRQRPPFHHDGGTGQVGIAGDRVMFRHEQAEVNTQTAVAIFRQAGEGVEVRDGEASGLQGFHQGVGEPLGELVKGHQVRTGASGRQGRMGPDIAEVGVGDRHPSGPDIAQAGQYGDQ